ncbi:hypothetical protein RIF29_14206 [Crotalaria pallida]|uniref:Uncharacterized protein n=1 Tax=Crotalaria pallida TaxID=3830 RepID=A0AAN9IA35_CROPI
MPNSIPPSPNSSSSSSSFHSLSHSSYSSLSASSSSPSSFSTHSPFFKPSCGLEAAFYLNCNCDEHNVQSAAEEIAKFPFGTNCSHSKGVYVIHVCN